MSLLLLKEFSGSNRHQGANAIILKNLVEMINLLPDKAEQVN